MEMHDAWFFIGIFVFIFLIWIATGGPLHPISFSGPSLALPDELGGGTYLSFPRAISGIGSSDVSLPGSSSGESVSGSFGSSIPSSLAGVAFGEVSPYHGIVSMDHYVSGAGSSDPGNEYISIRVASNAGVPVDLSGWTLESDASGNASTIPKGTSIPTSGIVNPVQDIVLTPGEQAIVISGQSPIGASFQENKCIGYFSTFQNFSPPLPQNCPLSTSEIASYYPDYIRDAACIDYVNTLSRCQVALTPPSDVSGVCQSFLVTYLNYNGCVDAHRNDADFLGDTWRVYLGRSNSMWRTSNEVVKLLDASGKTVDAFSY
ncbi:MAG TPA: hypothetical protein VNF51_03385 [Candidatus Paceibacterota bacterium]|nr:hypothetical protein [Candidatus Paceibacterota bacterium]